MRSANINILMTGGGAPGAAGILECLKKNKLFKITVADANPQATGKYLNDDFETIPLAEDNKFVDSVLSLCKRKNIKVVMPLVTKELIPLSGRIQDFEAERIKLLVSPSASLEIANNKSRLYEFLQWRDIPVPDFRIAENVNQFKEAATALEFPIKPICFKPSVSNGSRGFRIVTDQFNELDLLFNHKPNSTYIRLDEAIRILSTGPFPELLVSEYLPGDEYSVDCLSNQGEPVLIIPRLRKKMLNGISVEGEFVNEENIIAYCSRIIRELKLHGNIGIQVKRSLKGDFLILEINPRVQGTINAAMGAGVNLPELAVKQELKLPISNDELKIKWGVHFSKFWAIKFH